MKILLKMNKELIRRIKHKYYVMKGCFSVGLYKRGILHDIDKLSIYSLYCYAVGGEKLEKLKVRHSALNSHHPLHWLGIPMTADAIQEMVIDWWASTIVDKKTKSEEEILMHMRNFYLTNRDKYCIMNKYTRNIIEYILNIKE